MGTVADSERLLRETLLFHWAKWDRAVAWRSIPAMAICLALGIALASPGAGLIAAAGGFTAGFGSRQEIRGSRLVPMLLATAGITLSTFIGMLLGHQSILFVIVAGLWAALYALLTAMKGGISWVGQQCTVYLLVASAFHTTPLGSLNRCSLVLAGGLLQTMISWVVLRMQRRHFVTDDSLIEKRGFLESLGSLRSCGLMQTPVCVYGLRLALVVAGATEFYRHTSYLSGYWVPMTTLLVLRPDFFQTLSRGAMRVGGTVLGGWLSGLIAAYLHPSPAVLAILILFFAWWAFSLVDVNYALFTLNLTAYIVFLLSLAGLPPAVVVHRRAAYTLLGGAIALLAYLDVFRNTRLWIRAQRLTLPNRQAA
jgi:uncharacterized membrane protein YgaE (UPF0421/DUF939 family)